jgi:hypothetical protein
MRVRDKARWYLEQPCRFCGLPLATNGQDVWCGLVGCVDHAKVMQDMVTGWYTGKRCTKCKQGFVTTNERSISPIACRVVGNVRQ